MQIYCIGCPKSFTYRANYSMYLIYVWTVTFTSEIIAEVSSVGLHARRLKSPGFCFLRISSHGSTASRLETWNIYTKRSSMSVAPYHITWICDLCLKIIFGFAPRQVWSLVEHIKNMLWLVPWCETSRTFCILFGSILNIDNNINV